MFSFMSFVPFMVQKKTLCSLYVLCAFYGSNKNFMFSFVPFVPFMVQKKLYVLFMSLCFWIQIKTLCFSYTKKL